MVKILGLLLVLQPLQGFSAELNLSVGESAVIRANVDTVVHCGTTTYNCTTSVAGFKKIMTACQSTYSGGFCVDKYWPKFKKENPSCVNQAIDLCLDACEQTYSGGTCAEKCS